MSNRPTWAKRPTLLWRAKPSGRGVEFSLAYSLYGLTTVTTANYPVKPKHDELPVVFRQLALRILKTRTGAGQHLSSVLKQEPRDEH